MWKLEGVILLDINSGCMDEVQLAEKIVLKTFQTKHRRLSSVWKRAVAGSPEEES